MITFKEKLSSGKFFATVCVILTYCLAIIGCGIFVFFGKMDVQVFLGIFVGFSTMAGTIVTGYFNKPKQEV